MKSITETQPDRQAKIRWPMEPRQPEFTFVRELPFALVYPTLDDLTACPEPVCPEPVEWVERADLCPLTSNLHPLTSDLRPLSSGLQSTKGGC